MDKSRDLLNWCSAVLMSSSVTAASRGGLAVSVLQEFMLLLFKIKSSPENLLEGVVTIEAGVDEFNHQAADGRKSS